MKKKLNRITGCASKFRALAVGLLCMIGSAISAQTVTKVRIDELTEYIRKADHPLVVSFWATWCAPCVEEIPFLQEAVTVTADKKTELVLVSLDFPKEFPIKLTAFIREKNYKARFYWLNETNADLFCPKIDDKWSGAIPATLFINHKNGYRKFFEEQLTESAIREQLTLLTK